MQSIMCILWLHDLDKKIESKNPKYNHQIELYHVQKIHDPEESGNTRQQTYLSIPDAFQPIQ